MTMVLSSAGLCCYSIYIGVAVFGIIAVHGCIDGGAFTVAIQGNVLDNFPSSDKYALAMRLIMGVTLTLVYPMLCLPCRSTIDHLIFGGTTEGSPVRHAIETLL